MRKGCAVFGNAFHWGRISRPLNSRETLGIEVAINIIADPDWDEQRFANRPAVVSGSAGNREYQHQYPLPRNRELDHGRRAGCRPRDYRLFRHSACGDANEATAGSILSRTFCTRSACFISSISTGRTAPGRAKDFLGLSGARPSKLLCAA